ncbi:F-box and associated interaction domains-containing protein [Striga asiatica]|uniref:F-box and associated interaction domains-containing protein n=1 Tax=Striga asiatica TaxID=4170 RepID=A0A5A7QTU4_STRAF|nr:F-box and associated interaction domains-containing protein [Striga asiatica]
MAVDDGNDDVLTRLPQDIIFQIFFKLPPKTLLRLRCVSRFLNSLIPNPYFLNLHIAASAGPRCHHLLNYDSPDSAKSYFSFRTDRTLDPSKTFANPFRSVNGYMRLVGSCRGILCLFDTSYFTSVGTLIFWNPFIRKLKIVPTLPELGCVWTRISHMAVGFGFDPKCDDFKAVKVLYSCDDDPIPSRAFVYELKIGSWRIINRHPPHFLPMNWTGSVFLKGFVHWLAYERPRFNGPPNCIMGFDMTEEVFKSMELPKNAVVNGKELRLCPSADEQTLALFVGSRKNMSMVWDLWLMSDYGNVGSWNKVYTIVLDVEFLPLKITHEREILAVRKDKKLVSVNFEKDEVNDLEVCGLPSSFFADGYLPSLALLDCGEQFVE